MEIRLCTFSVLEKRLTWQQVQQAIKLAKESPANEHFMFYYRESSDRGGSVAGYDLLAMPRDAYSKFLANPGEFIISVEDYENPLGPSANQAMNSKSPSGD